MSVQSILPVFSCFPFLFIPAVFSLFLPFLPLYCHLPAVPFFLYTSEYGIHPAQTLHPAFRSLFSSIPAVRLEINLFDRFCFILFFDILFYLFPKLFIVFSPVKSSKSILRLFHSCPVPLPPACLPFLRH